MPWYIKILFIPALFISTPALAADVVLDFPSGRYQEDKPPTLFRWNLYTRAKSLALKVYRRNYDGSLDRTQDQLARFDFTGTTESFAWPLEPLPRGKYAWSIEGYSEKDPKALFREERNFDIEPMNSVDLTTWRYGLQVGFSRGSYESIDPNYSVEFQTTPTIYGVLYRGGDPKGIWDFSALMSDFTIRGAVRRSFLAVGSYSFRISEPNSERIDFFLGPTVRGYTFPKIQSPDGVNLSKEDITQLSTGLMLSGQMRLDFKITIYSQLMLDVPVLGSKQAATGVDQLGYGVTGGLLFGQFWPLAFGGEIQYRVDRPTTIESSGNVDVKLEGTSLILNTAYAF